MSLAGIQLPSASDRAVLEVLLGSAECLQGPWVGSPTWEQGAESSSPRDTATVEARGDREARPTHAAPGNPSLG